ATPALAGRGGRAVLGGGPGALATLAERLSTVPGRCRGGERIAPDGTNVRGRHRRRIARGGGRGGRLQRDAAPGDFAAGQGAFPSGEGGAAYVCRYRGRRRGAGIGYGVRGGSGFADD